MEYVIIISLLFAGICFAAKSMSNASTLTHTRRNDTTPVIIIHTDEEYKDTVKPMTTKTFWQGFNEGLMSYYVARAIMKAEEDKR